jgi:hypothetical protein
MIHSHELDYDSRISERESCHLQSARDPSKRSLFSELFVRLSNSFRHSQAVIGPQQ